MKTLSERLQWAIDHAGIKKIDLAKACGISRGAVSQWFNGSTQSLEGANLTNAARATGVNPHWLATGIGARTESTVSLQSFSNVEPGPDIVGNQIPLISWVQAGAFCTSPDLFHPGDAERWIPAIKQFGPHTYALRVSGDSMVSDKLGEKSYPEGCIIFVDPDAQVTNGCRVVARIHADDEATFKKYSEDAGKRYLRPLNKDYETIVMDDTMHICGVVVGMWMDE